ncbi:MAG: multidrug MFS transporter, partial [Planktotalea sp.]
ASFAVEAVFSAVMLALTIWTPSDVVYFGAFILWQTSIFFFAGLVFGNLNALAMEPVGHIAGMAASLIGGMATLLAMLFAVPVGLLFNGTPMPLAIMFVLASIAGSFLMYHLMRQEAAESSAS